MLSRPPIAWTGLAMAICVACASAVHAASDAGPSPPCESAARPAHALLGSPPNVEAWTSSELNPGWIPPACLKWRAQRYSALTAVAGTFPGEKLDAVLNRMGSISAYRGLRYWSVTDNRLEPLVLDAFAAARADANSARSDFVPAEMRADRDLFFVERDNRSSGSVLYRMRVLEKSPDRLVVEIANAGKVRLLLLTLFDPGDLRTVFFITRGPDGSWRCYGLMAIYPRTIAGLVNNRKSQINRLIALYGHIAEADDRNLPWAK